MDRRNFLALASGALLAGLSPAMARSARGESADASSDPSKRSEPPRAVVLFLCGDVMSGRGVDQILPHPSEPQLFERSVRSAAGYVRLAEQKTGPIPRPVDYAYVWGDALGEIAAARPDARIINLETAVTRASDPWPEKGIHYRMHPANVALLTAARIDCCVLANNHVLDWGRPGLVETLDTLHRAGVRTAGAGRDAAEATAAAIVEAPNAGRVLVLGFGMRSSGIPDAWAAAGERSGVNVLPDLSAKSIDAIATRVAAVKRSGDVVVASIHWGGNWGYEIAPETRRFAERLVETAGVDVVHGHSSHHVKAIQIHRDKLILYGCGDLLTDYEGIGGTDEFRGDLGLLYFPTIDARSGRLLHLALTPTRIRHFRIERARGGDAQWLLQVLNREGRRFGTRVELTSDDRLALRWDRAFATPPS